MMSFNVLPFDVSCVHGGKVEHSALQTNFPVKLHKYSPHRSQTLPTSLAPLREDSNREILEESSWNYKFYNFARP